MGYNLCREANEAAHINSHERRPYQRFSLGGLCIPRSKALTSATLKTSVLAIFAEARCNR